MALGIDIYRSFQKVTSYPGVKAAGVTFAWVKGTDGMSLAPGGAADNEVRGFQSVGIPVGLYHFSQPGSPEAQADVLLNEVTRLDATGVAAMLDMEDNPAGRGANIPAGLKREWVARFTDRVRAQGFKPCVYLNDSDAKAIRPDTIADDLVIVIARYGGKPRYGGRYDVHQFSSSGTIAGITARGVDLDESYTDNHLGATQFTAQSTPPVEDTMSAIPYDYQPTGSKNPQGVIPERCHTFALPVGTASAVTARAWLSFKSAVGPAANVRLMAIASGNPASYLVDKTFTNVASDQTRPWIEAPDGADQFTAFIRSEHPYSLGIETKAQ